MKHISTNLKTAAFTLVELLGVIAIIATLSSVVVASIQGSLSASREAAQQRQIQTLNSALAQWEAAGGTYNTWFYSGSAYQRAKELYSAMVGAGSMGAGKPDLGMPEAMPQNMQGISQLTVLIIDPSFWDSRLSMPDKDGITQYLSWYPQTGFHFESQASANQSSDSQPIIVNGQYKGHSKPTDPFAN